MTSACRALDAADTADIYEVIVERHRRATTIVTTNREPPGEWLAAMADPLLAESAIDRLTSNAYQLVVDGPSYRQRQRPGRARARRPRPRGGAETIIPSPGLHHRRRQGQALRAASGRP